MKCFSRYLPYIFRPPNTILSSSCHTEGNSSFFEIGPIYTQNELKRLRCY
ncbi:LOW QUALITY PROTEIN: PPP2R2B isoform 15 [Pan troglodytes]|uniref:PPP2R2B isoform 15 n=1 Tax=Pan troglodytes TaxID=9598 RepID=A0A2J8NJ63_PANTR|nr:LOW QUALITY PROTEIN: PPP2R2B isoform 15 [Pan troglodytes]